MGFRAREFMYPDQLATFVEMSKGAVAPVSITMNSSGHWILFATEEDGNEDIKVALEQFVDRDRGRGLELVDAEQRAAEAKVKADEEARMKAQAAASARAIAKAELEAKVRDEVEKEVRKRLGA